MASTHKSLRSSTANKRPTTAIADGQIALNTNATSPGLFFKDSTGASIIKIGPVHVGTTAPNVSPASGGSTGNSTGEAWLDTSLTPNGWKVWTGSAWVNATPAGSDTVQGLLELATNAETQAGSDTARAVTPAGLQSKISDSTSTSSSTTIASSTAVKSAYDLANAALPKSGGTITGNLEIGNTGSLTFEGATADAFETALAVADPTADRTITLPDTTGTVVTTGDSGTITSTMIADDTIVNGDINASAAIALTKLANITAGSVLMGNATNIPTATALSGDVTVSSSGVTAISSGVIVNADINASAAIAGTKISPDFGSQNSTTTGTSTAASFIPTSGTAPTNGVYLPAANSVAISTNGTGRVYIDSAGRLGLGTSAPQGLITLAKGTGNTAPTSVTAANSFINIGFAEYGAASNGKYMISYGYSSGATNAPAYIGLEQTSTGSYTCGDLTFYTRSVTTDTAPTERLRITNGGLVGIGTTSPASVLHVNQPGDNNGITLSHASRTGIWKIYHAGVGSENLAFYQNNGSTDALSYLMGRDLHYWVTNNTERVRIDSSGRVGIGTTTPAARLDVRGSSPYMYIVDSGGANQAAFVAEATNSVVKVGSTYLGTSAVPLALVTGGTERARIDSSGRLLVGTSSGRSNIFSTFSPYFQLEGGAAAGSDMLSVTRNTADIYGPHILLGKSRGTGNTIVASQDLVGTCNWLGNDGSNFIPCARIEGYIDGTPGANDMPGRLVFSTTADGASSPSERMRIDSLGALKTSPNGTYKFPAGTTEITHNDATSSIQLIASSTSFTGNAVTISTYRNTVNDSYKFLSCVRQGFAIALEIRDDGDVYNVNGTYGSLSDAKLKENIIDAQSQWDDIRQLRVRNYNFKPETNNSTHKQIGVIAQEIEDVSPGLVNTVPDRDEDGNDLGTVTKSVNYSVLYMKAVKALQEAMERIEQLESKVAALEGV